MVSPRWPSQATKLATPVWVTSMTPARWSAGSRANHGWRCSIAARQAAASSPAASSTRRSVAGEIAEPAGGPVRARPRSRQHGPRPRPDQHRPRHAGSMARMRRGQRIAGRWQRRVRRAPAGASGRAPGPTGWTPGTASPSAPHYDPANTHFGLLVVSNDDRGRAPEPGTTPHPHRDMEIVTWVLDGALVHQRLRRALAV